MFKTWSILFFFQFFFVSTLFSIIFPTSVLIVAALHVEKWLDLVENQFWSDEANGYKISQAITTTRHISGQPKFLWIFSELFRFVRRNFDYSAQIREKWFRLKMPRKEREKIVQNQTWPKTDNWTVWELPISIPTDVHHVTTISSLARVFWEGLVGSCQS